MSSCVFSTVSSNCFALNMDIVLISTFSAKLRRPYPTLKHILTSSSITCLSSFCSSSSSRHEWGSSLASFVIVVRSRSLASCSITLVETSQFPLLHLTNSPLLSSPSHPGEPWRIQRCRRHLGPAFVKALKMSNATCKVTTSLQNISQMFLTLSKWLTKKREWEKPFGCIPISEYLLI